LLILQGFLYTQTVSIPVPRVTAGVQVGSGNLHATTHTSLSNSFSSFTSRSGIWKITHITLQTSKIQVLIPHA